MGYTETATEFKIFIKIRSRMSIVVFKHRQDRLHAVTDRASLAVCSPATRHPEQADHKSPSKCSIRSFLLALHMQSVCNRCPCVTSNRMFTVVEGVLVKRSVTII